LILMADGTERPISEIAKGDRIIGVKKENGKNHFVESQVKEIWTTRKKRFTVYLKNGVKLKCSANHRWLTERGWRETAKKRNNGIWRPQLTESNRISSLDTVYRTPKDTLYYKQGYVYGAMVGDGTHGRYVYGSKKKRKIICSFKIACRDREIIDTVQNYLRSVLDVDLTYFKDKKENLHGIRSGKKSDHRRISFFLSRFNPSPVSHTTQPTRKHERARGFLSGIFDAEGSAGSNVIRISNSDENILRYIEQSLDILGFEHVRDKPSPSGAMAIRIRGGRSEYLRFFSLVHPRISRKFQLVGGQCKNSSNVVRVSRASREDHLLYDMETTSGNFIANGCVAHNCYARYNEVVRFKRVPSFEDWPKWKVTKDVRKMRFYKRHGVTMFPTTHDIFPEILDETVFMLKRLLKPGNKLLIVTKPHLDVVKRLCGELAPYKTQILWRFTIGTGNDAVREFWEPNAPSFRERFESLRYTYTQGYDTSVSSEPYLDDRVVSLYHQLEPYITNAMWIGPMNKMEERVDGWRNWNDHQMKFWRLVKDASTTESIWEIYRQLKKEGKVKWKNAIKEIVGIEKPKKIGMDI